MNILKQKKFKQIRAIYVNGDKINMMFNERRNLKIMDNGYVE